MGRIKLAKLTLVGASLACLGQTALADPRAALGSFINCADGSDVAARIADGCASHGWSIGQYSERTVECIYTDDTAHVALFGPRYASAPQGFARFTIIDLNGAVRVVANDQIEMTTAFGQTRSYRGSQGQAIRRILGIIEVSLMGQCQPKNETDSSDAAGQESLAP